MGSGRSGNGNEIANLESHWSWFVFKSSVVAGERTQAAVL